MPTDIEFNYTSSPLLGTEVLVIESTPSLSKGIIECDNRWYRTIYVGTINSDFGQDISIPYVARFGKPLAHRRIFFRARIITANGKVSSPCTTFADT